MTEIELNIYVEALVSFMLVVAGVFGLVGSLGLVKLRETMQRLHAPTKATTLGVGGVLIAAMPYYYFGMGRFSIEELMITIFLLVTAPVTANMIAKAYIHRNMEEKDLPESRSEYGWAGFDQVPDEDRKVDTR